MQIQENLYVPDNEETLPSFEELMLENETKIMNLIHGMTGDYHLAQDLTQETFIKAFKAKEGFRGHAKFSTWLYRIAVNVTLDQQRKRSVRLETEAGNIELAADTHPLNQDPEHSCQTKAMKALLFQAIARLPQPEREVFTLRDINGCSTKEVAEILNVSLPLVKWRLHKARLTLRQHLADGTRYQTAGYFRFGPYGIS